MVAIRAALKIRNRIEAAFASAGVRWETVLAIVAPVRRWWARAGIPIVLALFNCALGAVLLRPYSAQLHALLRDAEQARGLVRIADLLVLPPVFAALGLIVMSAGLALRARLAWLISFLLLAFILGAAALNHHRHLDFLLTITIAQTLLLLLYWRRFDRSSLTTGALFALLGAGSVMTYGVLGALWLGAGFRPPIQDPVTAVYYAVVTMSTVGYGDIVPHTDGARLFTVSLIVLGITVFATTLGVVIGPLVGGSVKRIVQGRIAKVSRKNHFVIIGRSTMAFNIFRRLQERDVPITVVAPTGQELPYPGGTDVLIGDAASDSDLLHAAGVPAARMVLILRDDDAENAFAVLAVKEIAPQVRTIAVVNDPRNLEKIRRTQPDIVFAPQLLGGELLIRTLFEETVDNDLINRLLFPTETR